MQKKIRYKEYFIKHKDREFHILIPDTDLSECWVLPEYGVMSDAPFIDGSRKAIRALRDAAITLSYDPMAIIYLPTRLNKPLAGDSSYGKMDIVLYTHIAQLRRASWVAIRKAINRHKPMPRTIKYQKDNLTVKSERLVDAYHHRKSSFYKKSDWNIHDEKYDALFIEGNVPLFVESLPELEEFLQRNLEVEARTCSFCPFTCALGIEIGYLTHKLNDRWQEERRQAEKEMKKYV